MRKSKMPADLLALAYRYGLAGKRVYVPQQDGHTLVNQHVPRLLVEIEADYERRGVTFSAETSPRKTFSRMFGKNMVAHKFNLKVRTAARVASAAWNTWREWFSRHERPRLEQVRALAHESGRDYSPLYFSYLEIRGRLRSGEPVVVEHYARFHTMPARVIEQVIELAGTSIASCPWRDHEQVHEGPAREPVEAPRS
jgi:hypothetical protein